MFSLLQNIEFSFVSGFRLASAEADAIEDIDDFVDVAHDVEGRH
jgi:hypothetical protein